MNPLFLLLGLGAAGALVLSGAPASGGAPRLKRRIFFPHGQGPMPQAADLWGETGCPLRTLWDGDVEGLDYFACYDCEHFSGSTDGYACYKGFYPEKLKRTLDTGAYLFTPRFFAEELGGQFYVMQAPFDVFHPIPGYRFKSRGDRNPGLAAKFAELPVGIRTAIEAGLATLAADLGLGVEAVSTVIATAQTVAEAAANIAALATAVPDAANAAASALAAIGAAASQSGPGIVFGAAVTAVMAVLFGITEAFGATGSPIPPTYLEDRTSVLFLAAQGGQQMFVGYPNPSLGNDVPDIAPPTPPTGMAQREEISADSWFAGLVSLQCNLLFQENRLYWTRHSGVTSEMLASFHAARVGGASISDAIISMPNSDLFKLPELATDRKRNEIAAAYWLNDPAFQTVLVDKLGQEGADGFRQRLGVSAGLGFSSRLITPLGSRARFQGVLRSARIASAKFGADPELDPPHADEAIVVYTPAIIMDYATWLDRKIGSMNQAYVRWSNVFDNTPQGLLTRAQAAQWAASVPPAGWDAWYIAWAEWYAELAASWVTQAFATWDDVKAKHQELLNAIADANVRKLPGVPLGGRLPRSTEDKVSDAVDTLVTGALLLGAGYVVVQALRKP